MAQVYPYPSNASPDVRNYRFLYGLGSSRFAGVNILASTPINCCALMIVGMLLAVKLSVTCTPEILYGLPSVLKSILSSNTPTVVLTALLLNILISLKVAEIRLDPDTMPVVEQQLESDRISHCPPEGAAWIS